jgi:hypothetical protein
LDYYVDAYLAGQALGEARGSEIREAIAALERGEAIGVGGGGELDLGL